MYFSGNDIKVAMDGNALDIVSIQFTLNQPTTPIYNHASSKMISQMIGTKIIYGSLALNYKEAYSLERYMTEPISRIEIFYDRTEMERDKSKAPKSEQGVYSKKRSASMYLLYDVQITGKQHAVGPSPENIVENFQFIAKDFVAHGPKTSYIT